MGVTDEVPNKLQLTFYCFNTFDIVLLLLMII